MSLQTRLEDLTIRIGTEFNTIRSETASSSHTHLVADIVGFQDKVGESPAVVANTAKVSADGSISTHSNVDLTGILDGNLLV
jgi:hypothetical protein